MGNTLPKGLRLMVERLLQTPGYTIRKVALETGVSHVTVRKYRKGLNLPSCPCGHEPGHRGWCSYRVSQSEVRQAFLRKKWGVGDTARLESALLIWKRFKELKLGMTFEEWVIDCISLIERRNKRKV